MFISSVMFLNLSVLISRVSSHLLKCTAYTYMSETQNCNKISNILACRGILKSLKVRNRYLMQEILILRGEENTMCYIAWELHCIEILEECTQEELKLQG